MKRIIEQTADGSATLFVPELNEHYHSVKGARTESQHIFIKMGLNTLHKETINILEIGFGTGLNALLTLEEAEKNRLQIHYTGIELYPLTWPIVEALKYSENSLYKTIHESLWEEDAIITPHFTLKKVQADANKLRTHQQYDLVYFDAFSPEKQPEMWSEELFNQLYVIMNEGGILTTYCAKGIVRRMLQTVGFTVERLPGPPEGKREILRASKNK